MKQHIFHALTRLTTKCIKQCCSRLTGDCGGHYCQHPESKTLCQHARPCARKDMVCCTKVYKDATQLQQCISTAITSSWQHSLAISTPELPGMCGRCDEAGFIICFHLAVVLSACFCHSALLAARLSLSPSLRVGSIIDSMILSRVRARCGAPVAFSLQVSQADQLCSRKPRSRSQWTSCT